jgi:hypothetical protein
VSAAACGATIHPAIDLPSTTIELPIETLPIETPIRAVPASVEVILGAVATHVEAALDASPTVIDTLRGIYEDRRRADQEPETEPYCAVFHHWHPSPGVCSSVLTTSGDRLQLTRRR